MAKRLPDPPYKLLAVPFFITIVKKCIRYKIAPELMKHLHFYDLQCLILQFEERDIREYLEYQHKQDLQKRGIKEVKHISGNEAVKFLGR